MSPETIGLIGITALLVMIFLRAPIGVAMLLVGVMGIWALQGWSAVNFVSSTSPVHVLSSDTLQMVPLFLLMGNFALHSGMAGSVYRSANAFVGYFRGGLAAGTILAAGGFSAICGSSLATVTTMARISVPEMLRYGYDPKLAAGAVGAGGTLGILIPPSLLMILYAYITETSVGRLFAAGIIPGIVAILLYCAAIVIWVSLDPKIAPHQKRLPFHEQMRTLLDIMAPALVFGIVMGGIFGGFFSPTEGAGVGAAAVLMIGIAFRTLGPSEIWTSVRETVLITGMVFLLLIGIDYFNFFMEASRLPATIKAFFLGLNVPPFALLMMIILLLVLLGCVLDSIAIVLIMTPFLYPIISHIGYDLIWFGIVLVMVVEIGLLTPPFGMNVFVINALVPQITLSEAFRGVTPFLMADFVRVGILIAFPPLCLWLPNLLFN